MAGALLFLLAEFFQGERFRRKRARPAVLPLQAVLFVLVGMSAVLPAKAQEGNAQIRSGNRFYKKKQIDQSLQQYQSAVRKAPDNPTANYNLGNAQFRKNNFDEAAKSYEATVSHSSDKVMEEKGLYNKGVAMIKQKKLQESINAWKSALKLDASDADARDNLEKALLEMKKQQQQQQQQKKEQQKDQKDKKEEKKNQDQQEQQQPKPQPSRLNKQQVEQLLKALQQKENDLQNKLNQNKVKVPNQPEKDW
jgi:tetratricopeptide (TPR) repeat protein